MISRGPNSDNDISRVQTNEDDGRCETEKRTCSRSARGVGDGNTSWIRLTGDRVGEDGPRLPKLLKTAVSQETKDPTGVADTRVS